MISIIIPVYNEGAIIKDALSALSYNDNLEVIVADGNSDDNTIEQARHYPVKIIKSIKNRAAQLNAAAKTAKGNSLLFLHADCKLEEGSLESIEYILNDGFVGGCLRQRIASDKLIYRFIEASGNTRAGLLKVFYGDQGIFVRRNVFFKLNGFDEVGLFDDVMFSNKLSREGKTRVLDKNIYTSPRRWTKQGIIKTTLINWFLTLAFIFGVSAQRLKNIYNDIR